MADVVERGAEAAAAGVVEAVKDAAAGAGDEAKKAESNGRRALSWAWAKVKTGAGEVEDYLTAPANVLGGRPGAQVARGIEGLTGGAKLAILDIVLGLLGWAKAEAAKNRPKPEQEKGESPPVHGA